MFYVLSDSELKNLDQETWGKLQPGDLISYYNKAEKRLLLDASWQAPKKSFALVQSKLDNTATVFEINKELIMKGQAIKASELDFHSIDCIYIE